MLHKFFEPGDWFAPKSYGYGAGLPIAWQGWAVLASFILLIGGIGALAQFGLAGPLVTLGLIALAIVPLVAIVHQRTRGGWRWRWGDPD